MVANPTCEQRLQTEWDDKIDKAYLCYREKSVCLQVLLPFYLWRRMNARILMELHTDNFTGSCLRLQNRLKTTVQKGILPHLNRRPQSWFTFKITALSKTANTILAVESDILPLRNSRYKEYSDPFQYAKWQILTKFLLGVKGRVRMSLLIR